MPYQGFFADGRSTRASAKPAEMAYFSVFALLGVKVDAFRSSFLNPAQ
jgi:hypothetical protein